MQTLISKIHQLQDIEWVKKVSEYVFCLAVLIEILVVLVDKSQLMNPIEGRLFQITFLLCTLKVIMTKYEIREYVVIFLMCFLGLMVDITGERNEILRMVMFVAACKDIDIKKCLKYVLWISVSGCLLLALLSATGLFGELVVPKEYKGEIFVNRFCFGMGNANAFHIMFFALVLLAMYVYSASLKWYVYVILFLSNIGVYFLTSCKTGVIMCAFSIVGMALVRFWKGESLKKVLGALCVIIQPFLILISIYFSYVSVYLYKHLWSEEIPRSIPIEFIKKLDNLLTGRILNLCGDTVQSGSLKTWTWLASSANQEYFDLGFVRLFYWYGIIASAIILIAFWLLSIHFLRRKKHSELIFITIMAVFTVVEAHFVSVFIGRNYALFLLGSEWVGMISPNEVKRC